MVRREVVASKIARAEGWLNDAAGPLLGPREAFLADAKGRDLALFYLFLAIQECMCIVKPRSASRPFAASL